MSDATMSGATTTIRELFKILLHLLQRWPCSLNSVAESMSSTPRAVNSVVENVNAPGVGRIIVAGIGGIMDSVGVAVFL